MKKWTTEDSSVEYGLERWGDGYFSVNKAGNVEVSPLRDKNRSLDLLKIIEDLNRRGIELPVMLRFDDIIGNRIERIYQGFEDACKEYGYTGGYRLVFPVKVNQQRHVVSTVIQSGLNRNVGLEVGSKPELLAVLAMHNNPEALLLCNGYKDREYIELAVLARKIGRRVIIIVEQFFEIDTVLEVTKELGIDIEIGLRMKPLSSGSGKWASSVGERAKFGLHVHEIISAIEKLKSADKLSWVKLLHFHMGSQLSSMVSLKRILREAGRTYVELSKLCPNLCFFDVGGGLGIDYEGSPASTDFSRDYTTDEYARNVVWAIQSICDQAGVAHPTIITESGRATVAQHSLLVTEIIDVSRGIAEEELPQIPSTNDSTINEIYELYTQLSEKNCVECIHDLFHLKEVLFSRFLQGDLSLVQRGYGEKLCNHVMYRAYQIAIHNKIVLPELESLELALKDTYFCNFSVFQSLPDYWAIGQLFPIMPIHRLDQEPTCRGILADLTCDSDGKISKFVGNAGTQHWLPLHKVDFGSPYYLGIFLTGAYQEILGDLHNLFGDANVVHVTLAEDGTPSYSDIVEGDTMREVLSYVQFDPQDLVENVRRSLERSVKEERISSEESALLFKRYKAGLEGYTYFVV
jgi:arginine decarboxylase